MQEAIVALVVGLAGMLTLMGAAGKYLLNRLKRLEAKEEDADATVRAERDQLRKRVADLEEQAKKVPGLEKQVNTLIEQVGELQTGLNEAKQQAADRANEVETLRAKCREKQERITVLETEKHDLEIEVKTFRTAFTLMGLERVETAQATGSKSSDDAGAGESAARTDTIQEG